MTHRHNPQSTLRRRAVLRHQRHHCCQGELIVILLWPLTLQVNSQSTGFSCWTSYRPVSHRRRHILIDKAMFCLDLHRRLSALHQGVCTMILLSEHWYNPNLISRHSSQQHSFEDKTSLPSNDGTSTTPTADRSLPPITASVFSTPTFRPTMSMPSISPTVSDQVPSSTPSEWNQLVVFPTIPPTSSWVHFAWSDFSLRES